MYVFDIHTKFIDNELNEDVWFTRLSTNMIIEALLGIEEEKMQFALSRTLDRNNYLC